MEVREDFAARVLEVIILPLRVRGEQAREDHVDGKGAQVHEKVWVFYKLEIGLRHYKKARRIALETMIDVKMDDTFKKWLVNNVGMVVETAKSDGTTLTFSFKPDIVKEIENPTNFQKYCHGRNPLVCRIEPDVSKYRNTVCTVVTNWSKVMLANPPEHFVGVWIGEFKTYLPFRFIYTNEEERTPTVGFKRTIHDVEQDAPVEQEAPVKKNAFVKQVALADITDIVRQAVELVLTEKFPEILQNVNEQVTQLVSPDVIYAHVTSAIKDTVPGLIKEITDRELGNMGPPIRNFILKQLQESMINSATINSFNNWTVPELKDVLKSKGFELSTEDRNDLVKFCIALRIQSFTPKSCVAKK